MGNSAVLCLYRKGLSGTLKDEIDKGEGQHMVNNAVCRYEGLMEYVEYTVR